MSSKADAGIRLGIGGERDFKKSLKEINDTMKVLGSKMLLVSAILFQDSTVPALMRLTETSSKRSGIPIRTT